MDTPLTEDEVFANDIDPLDAIREIRKEEGVPEEDLIVKSEDTLITEDIPADDIDELDVEEDIKSKDQVEGSVDKEKIDDIPETNKDDDSKDTEDNEGDSEKTADEDEDKDEKLDKGIKKFTANGQEFEFTQDERNEQFEIIFGKAMDYTQKTQKMAPFRKMISALEEEGISAEQLNTAIDALKGNKKALKTLMDANNIDPFDMDNNEDSENTSYTPTNYGKNDKQLDIEAITDKISGDPEYQITVNVIDKQWDNSSRDVLSNNPGMIQGLHNDIKSGLYDKVSPIAMKMKVLDGNTKSDLEYYMLAGEKFTSAEKQNSDNSEKTVADLNKKAQDADSKFDQASSEAQRKRSASPTRKRSDRKSVIDYLEDDDEAYDAWYKKLQASN